MEEPLVGRLRTFDIDHALNVAADMFWRRGYDGTSIGDLTKAIGISAPSFYFAFGSKDAVFRQIVEAYLARQDKIVDRAFAEADSQALVERLLSGFAEFLTSPDHAPGCLILNNSLPICDDHPFRAEWAEGRFAMRARLTERFSADQQSGAGFPSNWNPSHTARLVASLIWGIAVEAHSGASGPEIQQMIAQFLGMWPID
jgi:AcrR family transcriptional regulator